MRWSRDCRTALPPVIFAFCESLCHRPEPDWHFQGKPIHLYCGRLQLITDHFSLITASVITAV